MNKKMIIVSVIVLVFLVGIASATLLTYFGKITGIVSVSGPVFYLSHSHTSVNGHQDYSLNSDVFDGDQGYSTFTGDSSNNVFVTGPLGLSYIYPADYTFKIDACAQNNTMNASTGEFDFTLRVLHSDGTSESPSFCETQILGVPTVNSCSASNYSIYSVTCSYGKLNLSSSDGLKLMINDWGSNDITYHIKAYGASRIEVIPQ